MHRDGLNDNAIGGADDEGLARYSWADEGGVMAVCVCVVSGIDADAALDLLRGVGPESRNLGFYEAWEHWSPDATPLQIDHLDGALVLIEPNGWKCTDENVLVHLSAHGTATSVYWNVNALMRFVFAERGAVIRSFDPLLYDSTGALSEEADLRFGMPGQALASALLLLERLTGGVRVTADWLTNKAPDSRTRDKPQGSSLSDL